MSRILGFGAMRDAFCRWKAALGWGAAVVVFGTPIVLESLAQETGGANGQPGLLVTIALGVAVATGVILALAWRSVVASIGNQGLATIASIAGLQFIVSYAARLGGYLLGAVLGPFYVFIDGIGSKGLSCLFLGALITLIPKVGVLGLALLTLFSLNVITSGQVGLTALIFVAVSVALTEMCAALFAVTHGQKTSGQQRRWPFVLQVALALGLANALALYAQYALFELLLRLYFDTWYKLAVSVITGFVYGGCGAALGAVLGYRLRRTTA